CSPRHFSVHPQAVVHPGPVATQSVAGGLPRWSVGAIGVATGARVLSGSVLEPGRFAAYTPQPITPPPVDSGKNPMGRSRYVITEPDKPHFLTCTALEWLPLFTRPALVDILPDCWRYRQVNQGLRLYG